MFGDSIAQGLSWSGQTKLGHTVLLNAWSLRLTRNSDKFISLAHTFIEDASLVVVALGANYRYEKCSKSQVTYDIRKPALADFRCIRYRAWWFWHLRLILRMCVSHTLILVMPRFLKLLKRLPVSLVCSVFGEKTAAGEEIFCWRCTSKF